MMVTNYNIKTTTNMVGALVRDQLGRGHFRFTAISLILSPLVAMADFLQPTNLVIVNVLENRQNGGSTCNIMHYQTPFAATPTSPYKIL